MALQPVGPLPASTYWRRRVLLLVLFVIVVLVLVKACGGEADKESLSGPGPSPSPSAATSPTPSPTAAASPKPASPAPLQTCRDTVLQVTAEADAESYPSGGAPRFTLTVRNIGSVPCRRALGPDAVELRVFSGEDRIWSSDDCNEAKGQGVLTLKPGEAQALTVRWPGKRTKPKCDVGEVAQPGTYRVSARVGSIVRQGSVFRITG
ncbi:MAG: hypothetical protein QOE05_1826 [Actinomycetota bacterium]|jgi:hypothetical protein|nr:hypothetical protein [Actinomycetota bacterium]